MICSARFSSLCALSPPIRSAASAPPEARNQPRVFLPLKRRFREDGIQPLPGDGQRAVAAVAAGTGEQAGDGTAEFQRDADLLGEIDQTLRFELGPQRLRHRAVVEELAKDSHPEILEAHIPRDPINV